MSLRESANSLFKEAITLQRPSNIVLNSSPKYDTYFDKAERIFPVAIGKAGVMMMDGLLSYFDKKYKSKVHEGPIVVSNPQENNSKYKFKHIISSHPTPDITSVNAAREVLDYIKGSNENDLVVFLISGGGSSLLSYPVDGVSIDDKIILTEILLASGCNINEINTVRKHISQIKGGRLNSCALPSKSISLIISDVINDDLSTIASGPTVADSTTYQDAIQVLKKYNIFDKCPSSITKHLNLGIENSTMETPKTFDNNISEIISSNNVFKETLAILARKNNFNVIEVKKPFESFAISDAEKLFDQVIQIKKRKTILISGGETLVNLKGSGKGGRNQEFALSFLKSYIKNNSKKDLCMYSVGTDGIDGPTDAAGAVVDSKTIKLFSDSNLDLESYLSNNDSYTFFDKIDSLIKIGPTGTNVADIQITIIN